MKIQYTGLCIGKTGNQKRIIIILLYLCISLAHIKKMYVKAYHKEHISNISQTRFQHFFLLMGKLIQCILCLTNISLVLGNFIL